MIFSHFLNPSPAAVFIILMPRTQVQKMLLKKAWGAPVKSMLAIATPACVGSMARTVS
jgi:hypothetical protein